MQELFQTVVEILKPCFCLLLCKALEILLLKVAY